jgi:hypothetical protein
MVANGMVAGRTPILNYRMTGCLASGMRLVYRGSNRSVFLRR